MNNMRKAMIEELMTTLKIPQGNFNYATIENEIRHIENSLLKDFYKVVMSIDSFGNGMKVIINAASNFKPLIIDNLAEKAKELITMVETLNTQIGEDAKRMGIDFVKLVNSVQLPTVSIGDINILDNVAPWYDHHELIINIRYYKNGSDALNAFIASIEHVQLRPLALSNQTNKKKLEL